jgi:hypothetical protein
MGSLNALRKLGTEELGRLVSDDGSYMSHRQLRKRNRIPLVFNHNPKRCRLLIQSQPAALARDGRELGETIYQARANASGWDRARAISPLIDSPAFAIVARESPKLTTADSKARTLHR